ncbi:hypothetical protein Ancab_003427 [Ancistrocladus abbreviatus]
MHLRLSRKEAKKKGRKMSLEALAVAGVDCNECGINLEAWERRESEQLPLHLLPEKNTGSSSSSSSKVKNNSNREFCGGWRMVEAERTNARHHSDKKVFQRI